MDSFAQLSKHMQQNVVEMTDKIMSSGKDPFERDYIIDIGAGETRALLHVGYRPDAHSHPLLIARILVYEALPTIEHSRNDAAAGRRFCHAARLGGGNQRQADGGDRRE